MIDRFTSSSRGGRRLCTRCVLAWSAIPLAVPDLIGMNKKLEGEKKAEEKNM